MDTKGRALIVDDEDDIRALMTITLVRAGYHTTAVDSGAQALAVARDLGAPDIYVVDVRMPQMSGHDLCGHLKADSRTSGPVLLVSAMSSDEDIAAAFAAGGDDFLPKPFSPRELLARIEHLIKSASD